MLVEIVSPVKSILKPQECSSVTLPGSVGYLEILPEHAPLVTELSVGVLSIKKSPGSEECSRYFISGGYANISNENVIILADHIMDVMQISLDQAKEEKEKIEHQLTGASSEEEVNQLLATLKDIDARIEIGKEIKIKQI